MERGEDGAGSGTADAAVDVLAPMVAQRRADTMGVVAECALAGELCRAASEDDANDVKVVAEFVKVLR